MTQSRAFVYAVFGVLGSLGLGGAFRIAREVGIPSLRIVPSKAYVIAFVLAAVCIGFVPRDRPRVTLAIATFLAFVVAGAVLVR